MKRVIWVIALIAALWLLAMPGGWAQPMTQSDGGPDNWTTQTGCAGCGADCCRGGRGMGRGMSGSGMGCRGCGPGCCQDGRGYSRWQSTPPSQSIPVPKSPETVTGEVIGVDTFTAMNQRSAGIQLRLKTDTGIISVRLAPAWYLEHQDIQIKPGDRIEVKGANQTPAEDSTLIAAEVRKGDQVLVLRDAAGMPLWKGWRKMANTHPIADASQEDTIADLNSHL